MAWGLSSRARLLVLIVLVITVGVAAVLALPPLYREARVWWVLNVFPPQWTPSAQVPLERLASPYYHRRQRPVDTLVIHVTEGSLDSAISWFQRNPDEVSAHYLIGRDGRVVQMVDERFAAHHAGRVSAPDNTRWHDGNPNEYSIGIELESLSPFRDPGDLPPAQRAALWLLAKDIVARHRIPVDPLHIVAHSQVDPLNRSDPGPGFPWEEFLRDLGREPGSASGQQ